MVKKPMNRFELRNVSPDDFINQAKGLKLVKQRKRQEKMRINLGNPKLPPLRNAIAEIKYEAKTAAPDELVHKVKMHSFTKISDQIQCGFDIATKWKTMTYRELAEQLIMDGYFMPDFSWQQYEEDLRWDLHIDEKVLKQYAEEHNIILKEE